MKYKNQYESFTEYSNDRFKNNLNDIVVTREQNNIVNIPETACLVYRCCPECYSEREKIHPNMLIMLSDGEECSVDRDTGYVETKGTMVCPRCNHTEKVTVNNSPEPSGRDFTVDVIKEND